MSAIPSSSMFSSEKYEVHKDLVITSVGVSTVVGNAEYPYSNFSASLPTGGSYNNFPLTNDASLFVKPDIISITMVEQWYDKIYRTNENLTAEIEQNTTNTFSLDIPCDENGVEAISYNLSQYQSEAMPSWININSGVLTANAPATTINTTYQFVVQSNITSDCQLYQNKVDLLVYYKEPSQNNQTETIPQGTTTAAQAAVIAVMIVSTGTSFLSMSSLQSLWSILSIIQLTMLLPLTQAYIPEIVKQYLQGMSFVNFNFGFLPTPDLPAIMNIKFETHSDYLDGIGLQSGSTIINHIFVLILLVLLALFHLLLISIRKCCKARDKQAKWYYKANDKVIGWMTFGVYIRLIIESFQIMVLASLYEIKYFSTQNTIHIISLSYAFVISILSFGFLALMLVEFLRSKDPNTFKDQTYFRDIFTGTRNSWISRSFLLLNYGRRTLLVICVVFITTGKAENLGMFITAQLIYFVGICIMRPLETFKDNLIEILNELCFSILSSSLIYLNNKNAWSKLMEDLYYYTMISNTLIITIIIFIDTTRIAINKCHNKKAPLKEPKISCKPVNSFFRENQSSLPMKPSLAKYTSPFNAANMMPSKNRSSGLRLEELKSEEPSGLSYLEFKRKNPQIPESKVRAQFMKQWATKGLGGNDKARFRFT
ncbi:unnamed protein product [Moneuplotes crassus]|uniref:TRP C-terminal domain-containing protein n=1 Tax=Euplotes crassus TaxID=5936 RepID=A0AAD1XZF5_EUPCR|nr:unnamed protein product [Moneuplotes crassus]